MDLRTDNPMVSVVRILKRGIGFLFVAAALLAAPGGGEMFGASVVQAQTVSSIVVEGNRRVDAETIKSYLSLQPGQGYSAYSADESLKTLFATGLFSDVNINMRGNTLVVVVVENPIVNLVSFEGNKKLKDEVLLAEIESQPRSVLTRAKIEGDVQRILQLYRRSGRFGARVDPKIIDLPDNRANLVFEINEADKTSIVGINFIGNKAYGDGALRDVINTTERNWLSWLKSSDVYDPQRLEADQELLRRFYLKNGYADFRVISAVAELDRERNAFYVTITVDEGEKYQFGDIDVQAYVRDVDPESLRGVIETQTGDTYNANKVENTLEAMTLELANAGYAFAQVRPRGDRNFDTKTIDLTYIVEEGPRVYIERINIRGNTRTLDSVIRREFDFAEGDAYNVVMMDRAKRRLEALRYFEGINISRQQGSAPDRVVINVDVVEQPTGEVSVGGGYSTRDGLVADVSITERNLLGRGQILSLGGSFGEKKESIDFSFTEPYFLGRRLSAGVDAFYRDLDYSDTSSYKIKAAGGGLRMGFALNEETSFLGRYRLYQSETQIPEYLGDGCGPVTNKALAQNTCGNPVLWNGVNWIWPYGGDTNGDGIPDVFAPEASIAIVAAQGKRLYSIFGYDLTYSTLDSFTRPHNGWYLRFSQDLAGAGGDANYLRSDGEARYYREVGPDVVSLFKVSGGVINGWGGYDIPVTDTYFKGGETIRGFDTSGYGPRDLTPGGQRDALGGKVFAAATAEVQFPFPFIPDDLGFRGAFFADAGVLFNVGNTGPVTIVQPGGQVLTLTMAECAGLYPGGWGGIVPAGANGCYVDDTAPRASVGFSLMWDSPFGPLRADLGYAVLKEDYDNTQVFRFGAGKQF
ncbi:outer membrane protein assembly factor BamA [Microbaculum marinum]|uniref:Outer membrane protein assembly factor BamA n=1 Tax=Microbaculum marinum TaxID=1764581 RepID=A0AAW9RYX8_9HYPH